jgi:hypothetical protein
MEPDLTTSRPPTRFRDLAPGAFLRHASGSMGGASLFRPGLEDPMSKCGTTTRIVR